MKQVSAVLISDVHYSISTLEIADKAFRTAIDKAAELGVQLIDCGDLTNDKAIIRGEVANRLISTLKYAQNKSVIVKLLVGNHSLLNEKYTAHALEFLKPYAIVIDTPSYDSGLNAVFIPYTSNLTDLMEVLSQNKEKLLFMHQGLQGAQMGHYVRDTSSIEANNFSGRRICSGHYHAAQDILLPGNGLWSYIGSPYTGSFGEAMDPPKGYAVLYSDGSLERIPLNLRKHVIIDLNVGSYEPIPSPKPDDLVLVRMRGAESELKKLTRASIAKELHLPNLNFRLELIPNKAEKTLAPTKNTPDNELMDKVIENMEETAEQKAALKDLWRALV